MPLRAMALEALADLAAADPNLRDEALTLLEAARHSNDIALRSRARLMLPPLLQERTQTRR